MGLDDETARAKPPRQVCSGNNPLPSPRQKEGETETWLVWLGGARDPDRWGRQAPGHVRL